MSSSRSREEPSTPEQIGALVDDRLLRHLRSLYPVRIHKPGTPADALWFAQGQCDVVEFLAQCQRLVRQP